MKILYYPLTKGGDLINHLVNLFFLTLIINLFIILYSAYLILDSFLIKDFHKSNTDYPNF